MQNKQFTLYIGDLHTSVTEIKLYCVFCKAGTILSIRVCKDRLTDESLKYGYVNFKNHADAKYALETFNFFVLKGIPIRVMWSQRNPKIQKSNKGNIFVKNLPADIDNHTLYNVFAVYGSILSSKIVYNGMKSKCYGYVHYCTETSARYAIDTLNGVAWNGKTIEVSVFKRKEERFETVQYNVDRKRSTLKRKSGNMDICILDLPLDDQNTDKQMEMIAFPPCWPKLAVFACIRLVEMIAFPLFLERFLTFTKTTVHSSTGHQYLFHKDYGRFMTNLYLPHN